MTISVRYFAAAKAVLGRASDTFEQEETPTLGALVDFLVARVPEAAPVLARCTFLIDGASTRDRGLALAVGESIDVLPPFAGG